MNYSNILYYFIMHFSNLFDSNCNFHFRNCYSEKCECKEISKKEFILSPCDLLISFCPEFPSIMKIIDVFLNPNYEQAHDFMIKIIEKANNYFENDPNNNNLKFEKPTIEDTVKFLDDFRHKTHRFS